MKVLTKKAVKGPAEASTKTLKDTINKLLSMLTGSK